MTHQRTLFCFGLGYTAGYVIKRLRTQGGWRFAGTHRGMPAHGNDDPEVIRVAFDDAPRVRALLLEATHVLSSVPPLREDTAEAIDPVLTRYGESLRTAPALCWSGYLSTTGVYGDTGGAWVDETAPLCPSGVRGVARMRAETAWCDTTRDTTHRAHIFRLPGIYGPGRSVFERIKAGHTRRILKPDQLFNRIHVDDIAAVLVQSMYAPMAGEIFNVTDDLPATPAAVMTYAADLMGVALTPPVPFAEVRPTLSPMALSFWQDNRRVGNGKIKRVLGTQLLYPDYRCGLDYIWKHGRHA